MAFRKHRPLRKRRRQRRKVGSALGLKMYKTIQPKTFLFKRTKADIFDLGTHPTSNPLSGVNNTYAEQVGGSSNTSWTVAPIYTLNDIPEKTDFTNLFTHYKICGVQERYYLTQNPATAPPLNSAAYPANQMAQGANNPPIGEQMYYNAPFLIDSWYNPSEVDGPASQDDVYQIQRRKRRVMNVLGKKMYSKVKQLINQSNDDGTADYSVLATRNNWIPCEKTDVPHHGMTHWIRNATGSGTMPHISLRIERTYYIACRGVR